MQVTRGGVRVPLVVHWPAGIKRRGELVTTPGHLIDVMATCVDVAGAAYPPKASGERQPPGNSDESIQPLEGKSLVPAFDDKPIERDSHVD